MLFIEYFIVYINQHSIQIHNLAIFSSAAILQSLFINIWLLFRILILEIFSRYFDPVEVNLLFSTIINIASQ